MAQQKLNAGGNPKVLVEDETCERKVTLEWNDGQPTLIHRLGVDGVMPAQYAEWTKNYMDNARKLAPPNVTYEELGVDGGCKIIWQRIDPQVIMISARSLVTAAYHSKDDDGTEIFALSTKGNEHLAEQYKDKFGKDVMADLHCNAMFFRPRLDACDDVCGTNIEQVYVMNPNGSLPGMVVDKLISKQSEGMVMITKQIKGEL